MGNPLREELLKAGLAEQKTGQEDRTRKRISRKQNNGNSSGRLPTRRGRFGGSGSHGTDSASTGNRPDYGTEGTGVLSAELTEFLQRLTLEADEINTAYISCRADADAVRAR